jgi:hypothetical protein
LTQKISYELKINLHTSAIGKRAWRGEGILPNWKNEKLILYVFDQKNFHEKLSTLYPIHKRISAYGTAISRTIVTRRHMDLGSIFLFQIFDQKNI